MPLHYHYKCCVSGCSTQTTGRLYHRFPRNETLCKVWVERIGERRFIEMDQQRLWSTHKICMRHFHTSCKRPMANNALKDYSLPILHLPNCKLDPTPENYMLSRERFITLMIEFDFADKKKKLELDHSYCSRTDTIEEPCEVTEQSSDVIKSVSKKNAVIRRTVSKPSLKKSLLNNGKKLGRKQSVKKLDPKAIEAVAKIAKMLARKNVPTINSADPHKEIALIRKSSQSDDKMYFDLTKSDFTNICFVCHGLKAQVSELYNMNNSYFKNFTIQSILKKVDKNFQYNTKLPQYLCFSCLKILLQTHQFLEQLNSALEMYEQVLTLGTDFHVFHECYYRDDLNDIRKLLSFCKLKNVAENGTDHPPDTHINPNICNSDIVNEYIINSKERIFEIEDAECITHKNKARKDFVQKNSKTATDFTITTLIDKEISIDIRENNNLTVDINNSSKSSDKTGEIMQSNNSDDLAVTRESISSNYSDDDDEVNTAANEKKEQKTIDYRINIKMALGKDKKSNDYDDFCDVDFDEDIDALDDFKLAKFSTRKNPTKSYRKYRCRVCFEIFTTNDLVRSHRMKMGHFRRCLKIFHCNICKRKFQTSVRLHVHSSIHQRVQCKICGKKLLGASLKQHLKFHLSNGSEQENVKKERILCSKCGKTYSKAYMYFHTRCNESNGTYKCEECSFSTNHSGHMARHTAIHEKNAVFRCDICKFTAFDKSCLQSHIEGLHTKQPMGRMFECILCEQQFPLKYDFLKHNRLFHNIKNVKLPRKSKIKNKKEKSNLMKNRIIGFKCQICDQSFRRKCSFLRHAEMIHGYPIDKLQSKETTTFPVPAYKAVPARMQSFRRSLLQQHATRMRNQINLALLNQPPPIPDSPQPSPIPHSPQPSTIPDSPQPSPIPHSPQPSPIPHSPQPSPIPHSPQPSPIPHSPQPSTIPDSPQPSPIPHSPQPSPIPHSPQPSLISDPVQSCTVVSDAIQSYSPTEEVNVFVHQEERILGTQPSIPIAPMLQNKSDTAILQEFRKNPNAYISSHYYRSQIGYHCRYCSVTTETIAHILTHVKIHCTGELFKCTECLQVFNRKANLLNHILYIHSDLKPYKCLKCDRTFKSKANFYCHMASHDRVRIICNYCNTEFFNTVSLDTHRKTYHNTNADSSTNKLRMILSKPKEEEEYITSKNERERQDFTRLQNR